MNDMLSKISELLSDPAQAEKIKQLAGTLAGGQPTADTVSEQPQAETPSSGADFSGIMSSLLGSGGAQSDDKMNRNIALLNAMSPFMRPSRSAKVASAIKAIQIINILSKAR